METNTAEFSKLLDKTNYHLTLQAISSYINLPEELNDEEKEFIHLHLKNCKSCTDSFELIFDETLELDGKKIVSNLCPRIENTEEETKIFHTKNNKVEIEVSRLSKNDFNLRFRTLPPALIKEKAALKAGDRHFLRILSLDTETVSIVHSEEDLMDFGSFELISVIIPEDTPDIKSSAKSGKINKIYWYSAVAIIIGAVLIIYFTINSGMNNQNGNQRNMSLTDFSTGGNQAGKKLLSSETPKQKSENVSDKEKTTVTSDFFAANEKLEYILGKNRINDPLVALVSPGIGATVKMPVTFEWLTSRKNVTLKFVILTNQNIPVYNNLINGRALTIDTKLDPGLYYWMLESKDSVEALGKFLIR